ncbi:MAG: LIC12162 family protein [Candidatus Omnitrophica bacterium]|nr:LIC12162 family protein [Candidatus Omnitrophota bacterium]
MGSGRQFLATTGISEFWNTDEAILLLGPWCLMGEKSRKLIDTKTYPIVPSPWKPAKKVKNAADLCHDIYENVLPELSEQLNLVHDVGYSEKYWRVLIGPWLTQFIEVLYERCVRVDNAFALFPDTYTYILPGSLSKSLSLETYDSISAQCVEDDFYNLKLFSQIIRNLYPEKAVEKNITISISDRRSIQNTKFIKKAFYGIKKIRNIFKHPSIILSDMYHFDFMQILSLESRLYLNPVIFENFDNAINVVSSSGYSEEKRKKIRFEKVSGKFPSLLRQLLPIAIPKSYIENFNEYKKGVKPKNIKAIGSAVGWYHNENFKFFAAEAALTDAKLLSFQQGGGYGMALTCPVVNTGVENSIFYAWGCNSRINKTRTLPSPHLSKLVDSHFTLSDKIIFVGTSVPKYQYRFNSTLFPDDMTKYFEDKRIFLKSLPERLKDRIFYRPYHYEYGWGEKEFIKNILPNVIFLSKGNLTKYMQQAKLVVIDHPHTSFLEALTINVPSVFYWDHKVHLMLPEAEEYFDLLRIVGILYQDPVSAAKKVNEIIDNPMDWWLKKEVQNARSRFCEYFACARENWLDTWTCELNNIVTQG